MVGRRSRTIEIDESLEGWVLLPSPGGALVGRLECSELEVKGELVEKDGKMLVRVKSYKVVATA